MSFGKSDRQILIQGAAHYGVELDETRISLFEGFYRILEHWNRKFNLTSIEGATDTIIRHYIDSLSITPIIKSIVAASGNEAALIDIGAGAGFPSVTVKIVLSQTLQLKMVLIDSSLKKVGFIDNVIRELDLKGIEAIHGRAEDLGARRPLRESHQIAVARAVAPLPVLLEYSLPFVTNGGCFIAMKGSRQTAEAELETSSRALSELGGAIEDVSNFTLPFSDFERTLILIKKFRQTPSSYPRRSGKPTKSPL